MLTSVFGCGMIFVLGRFRGEALFFAARPKRNDPWRFRQQSSRVISVQFWYLTSLVTSLSVGSAPMVSQWLICKTCIFRRIFFGVCFGSYYLGSLKFTCTLVSPFFVPSVYHIARHFTRRDFTQITCE